MINSSPFLFALLVSIYACAESNPQPSPIGAEDQRSQTADDSLASADLSGPDADLSDVGDLDSVERPEDSSDSFRDLTSDDSGQRLPVGAPCQTGEQCEGQWCFEMGAGPACTKPCIWDEDCPSGYKCGLAETGAPEIVFLCFPDCLPDCVEKLCGEDGCGGSCGTCPDGCSCIEGYCSGDSCP